MKLLSNVLLAINLTGVAMAAPVHKKPINPDTEFKKQFYIQIDAANKTLETVVNLPCSADSKTVESALMLLEEQLRQVSDLTAIIPETQPELEQVKEIEATYGLLFIAKDFVKSRTKSCQVPETPTYPPTLSKN